MLIVFLIACIEMKLRTTSNSIRLRLSQTDVQNFAETGFVEETLNIDRVAGQSFSYKLQREEMGEQLTASFENGCLSVYVPAFVADVWTSTDQVGTESEGTNDRPSILIEKDFACLKPRAGEDDIDTFPNPEAKAACR
jgi:hypothetical protein